MQMVLNSMQNGAMMSQINQSDGIQSDGSNRIDTNVFEELEQKPARVSHNGKENLSNLDIIKDKGLMLWKSTPTRIGMIAGGVGLAGLIYFAMPGEKQQVYHDIGRDGVAGVDVYVNSDEINADQAAYLSRKQQEQMQAKAEAGQTNAAVLDMPTVIDEQGNVISSVSQSTQDDSYLINDSNALSADLKINGLVVKDNPRFSQLHLLEGVFVKDLNTNQYYKLSTDGKAFIPSDIPGTPRKSETVSEPTMQAQSQYQPNQDSNNFNGNQGDGGFNSNNPEPAQQYSAEEDPDIKRFRTSFHENYDIYQQQSQNANTAMMDYQNQLIQHQQQLVNERQAIAQQSFQNTLSKVNGLGAKNSSYGVKTYSISSQSRQNGTSSNYGISSQSQANQHGYTNQAGYNNGYDVGVNGGSFDSGSNVNADGGFNVGVDSTLKSPMQYNRQATQGIVKGKNPGEFNDGVQVSGNANGTVNQKLGGTAVLPSHIVRAGTNYTVVVTKTTNSDYGTSVEARVMSGPFAGSTVYGSLVQQGRNAGIVFNSLQKQNPKSPIIPLTANAYSLDGKNGVAQVKRHYAQNYTHMALTSVLQGYGEAYANTGKKTTVERGDGTVITTSDGGDVRKEIEGNIAREFAAKLQQDVSHLGNRGPTYIVPAGTVLTMRFLSDWDTTQTSSSISN